LACADEPSRPENVAQCELFNEVCQRFDGVRTSIGNSAGSLSGPEFQGDVTRAGIGLYGGNPFKDAPTPVQTVATFEARILQIREVPAGAPVGYGATNRAKQDRRVAILGLGYADGLSRALSNRGCVVLGGRRCPIVGSVSMDLTDVDVTGVDVSVGDWVEVFGAALPIDEVARQAGTIAYELLTGIGSRVPRVFQD
jgi:alanine racemase